MHPYIDSVFLDRLIAANLSTEQVYAYLEKNYPPKVLGWVREAQWAEKTVPLSQIDMHRRPGGRNMDKVKAIADKVRAGARLDPVVLVQTGPNRYDVADGYHRLLGYKHAGVKVADAWVGSGVGEHGPWEADMHAAKLNVAPGEKAAEA